MPFAKGYDHDVFISYATVDDCPAKSGWVSKFVSTLNEAMAAASGVRDLDRIWWDRSNIDEEAPLTEQIRNKVQKSACMVVILSRGYANSNWCSQEREAFLSAVASQPEADRRLFLIDIGNLDQKDRPPEFRNKLGRRFFVQRPNTTDFKDREPLGFPIPDPTNKEHKDFFSQVHQLAMDICERVSKLSENSADALRSVEEHRVGVGRLEAVAAVLEGAPRNVVEHRVDAPFDVFLCHNTEDKQEVRDIAKKLRAYGLTTWLDEEQLRPGVSWQDELEKQVEHVGAVAIFVGSTGLGPWQNMEEKAFLRASVKRGCPVIPVLLKNAPDKPKLPVFLEDFHWVDFRVDEPNPLEQLVWGIKKDKPLQSSIVLYVAESADDVADERENVVRFLSDNFHVLPAIDDPLPNRWDDWQKAVDADLKASTLFVQVLGTLPGRKIAGGDRRLVIEQFERAKAAGMRIVSWRKTEPEAVADVHLKELVAAAEYCGPIREFMSEAKRIATPVPQPDAPAFPSNPGVLRQQPTVFIQADIKDRNHVHQLSDLLKSLNCFVQKPLLTGTPEQIRNKLETGVAECAGLILFYVESEPEWVEAQFLDLPRRIFKRHKLHPTYPRVALAICKGAPPDKPDPGVEAPDLAWIDLSDDTHRQQLAHWVSTLQTECTA
jgi:nucleotide-binding universal stress UspA family protein